MWLDSHWFWGYRDTIVGTIMFICLVRTSVRVGGEIHTTGSVYQSHRPSCWLKLQPRHALLETRSSHASAVRLRGEYCPATTRSLP